MTSRVCPACSALSETEKDFCPECGTKYLTEQGQALGSGQVASSSEGLILPLVFSWLTVAFYVLSFLIAGFDDEWEWAIKTLKGYYFLTEVFFVFSERLQWVLLYPGVLLMSLAAAVLLTLRKIRTS
jgi:uncharacterized paraquat-inducible protein A